MNYINSGIAVPQHKAYWRGY